MKKIITLSCLILFLLGGCASTKEVAIKDFAGIIEKPSWNIGDRWIYKGVDSKGNYESNVIEYLGQEEKQGITYHVFTRNKGPKRYFTEDFHWAFTLIRDKEGYRVYEIFDPPDKLFEFPLQNGKSWQHDRVTSRIEGDPPKPRTGRCVIERKVSNYVRLDIRGKSYDAYKIEGKCQLHGIQEIYWYAPSVKNWVKRAWYTPDGRWWQEELANYEPK